MNMTTDPLSHAEISNLLTDALDDVLHVKDSFHELDPVRMAADRAVQAIEILMNSLSVPIPKENS